MDPKHESSASKPRLEPLEATLGLQDGRTSPLSDNPSDAAAIEKLGITPTMPRSLNRLLALIGLNSSVVSPWPAFVLLSALNLANGGTAGLLVGVIVACVFISPTYISLAGMMAKFPTAGGQYHFVAALAPPKYRRFLSFLCCCILTFTWISYLAGATWLFGLEITAIIVIYTGKFAEKWAFLSGVCMQVIACIVNLTWGKHMNIPEMLVLVVHVAGFFLLVGLLGYGNASGTVQPNFAFTSATGWSPSFGTCLSVFYAVSSLVGFDSVCHMAEDTVDASKRAPKSLLWTIFANMLASIVCAVMVVISANDVEALFTQPIGASGHPLGSIIQLIFNAVGGNKSLASSVFAMIAVIFVMSCINITAAASRTAFSFIRDDNNPAIHRLMARDLKTPHVPRITILLTSFTPCLILWISFVSDVGFSAIVSQLTLSLTTTYIMAVSCSLYSRFARPDVLGRENRGIMQLGTFWGKINDTLALAFLVFIWVISWFPVTTPVNAKTLNYAPIIVAGIAFAGIVYYAVYARKHYRNPAPEEEICIHEGEMSMRQT